MKETVLKYLYDLAPESKARLTKHFEDEVEEFGILIAKMIETLQNYESLNQTHDENVPKQVAYGLMTKGANTLMAAFELALNGYMWEPPVLFRSALEGFASAWDIVHNDTRFTIWRTGKKFDSADSIKNLKKAIEPVGKMYGFLSNLHVHTSPLNSSPSMLLSDEEPKLQFFGLIRAGKEHVRKGEIYFSLLAAYVCLQLTELVFHQYSRDLETIEKISGTDCVKTKVTERHQKFVDTALQHFKTISEDPSICF